MRDRVFLDTNILIYAIESSSPSNKALAARKLIQEKAVVISTQVLGEFYNASTSKRRTSPLTHVEATCWIQTWKRFEVCSIHMRHVDLAIEIASRFQLSYYDSLIVAAARDSGCRVLYSEDLNAGQSYSNVHVLNPLPCVES